MSADPLLDITDKCILVTGASSGLGAHFAELAALRGARVVLAARREERLASLASIIESAGGQVFSVRMDVCDESSIAQALECVEREFSPVDVLVNNAGVSVTRPFLETDNADWRYQLETNVIGLADVARQVARRMIAAERGGAILNIGSILGVRAGNMAAAYAASKAAVIHLNRGMAIELARHAIRVNALLPGFIASDLSDLKDNPAALERLRAVIPQRRTGDVQDLDGAFLLLVSEASRYMTGSTITVDGGHSSNSL